MKHKSYWAMVLALLSLTLSVCVTAQEDPASLGDVARALRQQKSQQNEDKDKDDQDAGKKPSSSMVIDNDNFSKIMEDISSGKLGKGMLFSFDKMAETFKVSSPDVTCSLSFNAQASALLFDPFTPRELPPSELAKLDGPASIQGDTLQVAVRNGTTWKIREITIGFTILNRAKPDAATRGPAKLLSAVSTEIDAPAEKQSDLTVLYKMKGTAEPLGTTVFSENLNVPLAPDQEWHWAIVGAKGIAPPPASVFTPNTEQPPAKESIQ